MKLEIGPIYLGREMSRLLRLFVKSDVIEQYEFSELFDIESSKLKKYLNQITEVVLGFVDFVDIEFLKFFPSITELWILAPKILNLEGLCYLQNLKVLTIDRPTYRLNILGELTSLEELYVEDWRSGIESIFQLPGLKKVHLQKYKYTDLQHMTNWQNLQELCLNRGNIECLSGIPVTLNQLEITNLRHLKSIKTLSKCSNLTKLILEGSKNVNSLDGLQNCTALKFLSISRIGDVDSLSPLGTLVNLEHLFLADGLRLQNMDVGVLYHLPNLRKLIISKQFGVQVDRLLKAAPNCEVIFAG